MDTGMNPRSLAVANVNNDEYAKPKAVYGGIVNDDFDEYQVRFQFNF